MEIAELLELQHRLQVESFGSDPLQLDPDARAEFLRWNAWALTSELVEVMDETGWKPWATSRHVNVDQALGEMVDALHFFANMALAIGGAAGMTTDEIAYRISTGYLKKRQVNAKRQEDGYDGVKGKCGFCHRDLNETVLTHQEVNTAEGDSITMSFCPCGTVIPNG